MPQGRADVQLRTLIEDVKGKNNNDAKEMSLFKIIRKRMGQKVPMVKIGQNNNRGAAAHDANEFMRMLNDVIWAEIQNRLNSDNIEDDLKAGIKTLFDFYVSGIESCGEKVFTSDLANIHEDF